MFGLGNNQLHLTLVQTVVSDTALLFTLPTKNGGLQDLELPESLKGLYKTVWEIKQRVLVDMAADRGAYIDQSQSFNVHMSDPNFGKLTSLHFHGWKVTLHTTYICL